MLKKCFLLLIVLVPFPGWTGAESVKIGLNYPMTGPYSSQGTAQHRAVEIAVGEINAKGGILGRKIELVLRDSKTNSGLSKKNVGELIDAEGCEMVFGGASSGVAIAGGYAARAREKIYFGTTTNSNSTTGKDGHKYMFREHYNAWMGARVLSEYLRKIYLSANKKYFFITANYSWGHSSEASIRKFTNTSNGRRHKGVLTPFPGARDADFRKALKAAEAARPDVLVLVLFGRDMIKTLRMAAHTGLKRKVEAVVVPGMDLNNAHGAGPEVMEGVIGAVPWFWNLPNIYGFENGKRFVKEYVARYNTYPTSSSASAYTILHQYRDAVERAGSFDAKKVIAALEGHEFVSLKDKQQWRDFDHQCIQTVYAVKCKPANVVLKDKFKQDYFEIIHKLDGGQAAIGRYGWERARKKAGKPISLEW